MLMRKKGSASFHTIDEGTIWTLMAFLFVPTDNV